MTINIRAVRLQAPSDNSVQAYTISGFGTAQGIIVWSGVAGDNADVANIKQSFGFWDTTNTRCMTCLGDDAINPVSTAHASQQLSTSNVVEMRDTASGTVRSATVAPTTDGVNLTWAGSDTGIRPWTIVILINGCNDVQVEDVTPAATDGGTAVATTTAMTPKVVFGIQARRNFGDAAVSWKTASFGYAYDNGATIDQHCLSWESIDTDTNLEAQIQNNRISQEWDSSSVGTSQEVTAMVSGSFTITNRSGNSTSGADHDLGYLAIDFDEDVDVFESEVPTTDVAWTPYSGGGITPNVTIMLASFATATNIEQSGAGAGFFGLYVANANEEMGIAWCDEDAATTTNASGRSDTRFFIQTHTAGGPDFAATNPQFSAGQIQYSAADSGEGSQASKVLGIAFAGGLSTDEFVPVLPQRIVRHSGRYV